MTDSRLAVPFYFESYHSVPLVLLSNHFIPLKNGHLVNRFPSTFDPYPQNEVFLIFPSKSTYLIPPKTTIWPSPPVMAKFSGRVNSWGMAGGRTPRLISSRET